MNKIKIDIISGFLGAGKTTFIKNLIQNIYWNQKVVILENEFGKINIDQKTLESDNLIVQPVHATCICCTGAADLTSSIYTIIDQYQPQRIIIEPTGVAKLSEIKKIIFESNLFDSCEIDHILTIVDSKNYRKRVLISKEFFEDQIRTSELIILSKTDTLENDEIEYIKSEIIKINPSCLMISRPWNELSLQDITLKKDHIAKKITRLWKKEINDFENFELLSPEEIPVHWIDHFVSNIENGFYGEVHRMKGICFDKIKGWYSIQYVPGEHIIEYLDPSTITMTESQICIIGIGLNKETLKNLIYC